MLDVDYKWTVRVDAGAFMGDEDDRLIWHYLSSAATIAEAIVQTWDAHPRAVAISAFPKLFG